MPSQEIVIDRLRPASVRPRCVVGARVSAHDVHEPWKLTRGERRSLCPEYPPPVVDLDEASGRAFGAPQSVKRGR